MENTTIPSEPLTNSPPTIPWPPWPPGPRLAHIHISRRAEDALLAGFVVFLTSTFVFAVMAARLHARHRVFHLLSMVITGIAALSYYSMVTGGGVKYVPVGHRNVWGAEVTFLRPVYWARYVDWVLTTPLLVLELTLLGDLPLIDVVSITVVSEATALTALFAGMLHDTRRATWGWFAIGCVLFVYGASQLLWKGRKSVKNQNSNVSSLYTQLSIYIVIIWFVYTLIFALSQGIGILDPSGETIAYTVLDIFGKAVFGILLLVVHKHDSEDAAVSLSEYWTEPRGARRGSIHLPGGEE